MGLSASQARLLSITARLSDNELHSQQIANAKVRLADQTQQASADYIKALDSSKLVYTTYDANGEQKCVDLTPGLMYTYSPMKNQYAMMTADNKILVSKVDADNYENSKDLFEFLSKYDLLDDRYYQEQKNNYDEEMAEYRIKKAQYDADMRKYNSDMEKYNADMIQYDIDYKTWLDNKNGGSLYNNFISTVGRSDMERPTDYTKRCYYDAITSGSSCYLHVLNHLLDYNGSSPTSHTYMTSIGEEVTTYADGGNMGAGLNSHTELKPIIKEISDGLNDESIKCDGADDFTPYYASETGEDILTGNIIEAKIEKGEVPTEFERLASDYIYDPETNTCTGIKTLKQKAIDLYYIIKNISSYTTDLENYGGRVAFMRASMINFTEGDMKNISPEPVKPIPPTMPNNKPLEPQEPNYFASCNDQDKGQWYINLWHAMNGSKTSNLAILNDEEIVEDGTGIYRLSDVAGTTKAINGGSYKVLEENLMSSSSWLQFALKNGVVTLAKAEYYNPSADSEKAVDTTSAGITWQSIAFSSAVDIHEIDDEKAIAKAEAEYTQKLNEIEAKDKKYDNDIKKLDTEHNALKTEYESVQNVINKNVERSFKAFS